MNKKPRKKLEEKDWSFKTDEWTIKTIREMFGFSELSNDMYNCQLCRNPHISQTVGGRRITWHCRDCTDGVKRSRRKKGS